jgi:hypothetical protein
MGHCSAGLEYSPYPPTVRKIWTTNGVSDTTNAGKDCISVKVAVLNFGDC